MQEEEAIRALAYELWEKAGRPDDDAQGFWYAAEAMLGQQAIKENSREEAGAASLVSVGALVIH